MDQESANLERCRYAAEIVNGSQEFWYKETDGNDISGVKLATAKTNSGSFYLTMRNLASYMRVEHEASIQLQARLQKLEEQVKQLTKDNIALKAFYDAKMSWDETMNKIENNFSC